MTASKWIAILHVLSKIFRGGICKENCFNWTLYQTCSRDFFELYIKKMYKKLLFLNVILQLCFKNCSHFATTNMLLLCENLKTPSFFRVTNQYEWKMHDKNINVCKTVHTCSHGIAVKVNTMAMLGPANKSLYGS